MNLKIVGDEESIGIRYSTKLPKIVIYQERSLVDKILVALHPSFDKLATLGVGSPPRIEEFKSRLLKREVIVIGNGFSHLFTEITATAIETRFILRPEDVQPDLDQIPCSVENWFNYWTQLTISRTFLCDAVYNYMYKYPSIRDRELFQGLQTFGIESMNPQELLEFLENPPIVEVVLKQGKDQIRWDQLIIDDRISKKRDVALQLSGIKFVASVTFGDSPMMETVCQLKERADNTVAIILKLTAGKPLMITAILVSEGDISALDVGKLLFDSFSGTKYVCYATSLWSETSHKLFEELV